MIVAPVLCSGLDGVQGNEWGCSKLNGGVVAREKFHSFEAVGICLDENFQGCVRTLPTTGR